MKLEHRARVTRCPRCKTTPLGLALIADLSRSNAEVACELGVHRQTVVSYRADLRRR